MSATNWAHCPNCAKKIQRRLDKRAEELKEWYGERSPEVYNKMLTDLEADRQKYKDGPEEELLREDYEIGVNDDLCFQVFYRCRCEKCGYTNEYEYSQAEVFEPTP